MTRFDFCCSCRSRARKEDNDMRFSCVCGSQGLCQACANYSTCSECGNGCCKDCSFSLPCCGKVLCGSGRLVHGGTSISEQSCFSNHKTTTTRPCGHYGCNFHDECLTCIPKSVPVSVAKQSAQAKQLAKEGPTTMPVSKAPSKEAKLPVPSKVTPTSVVAVAKQPAARAPRAKRSVRSIYKEPLDAPKANLRRAKKTKVAPAARRGHEQPFPQNVHAMVTETANVATHLISWIQNGEAFVVHNPKSPELGEVLQKFFDRKSTIGLVLQ